MICSLNRIIAEVFLCLAIFLCIKPSLFAFDKKASYALSHYIMAVMYDGLQDMDSAIGEYKKALRVDYKNAIIHLDLAASLIKNNEIPKAIEELNLSVGFNPEAVEPHAVLALLYSLDNQSALAQKEYEAALKIASNLEPKNVDFSKSLGRIYLEQKRFKEAESVYRLIVDFSPEDAEAHFYLGNVYYELGKKDDAIKELKKALELKPDYPEVLNYLGYFYIEENTNLGQAEAMIKKALEFEPDNGAYLDSLGWFYFKKNKIKEALTELERASTLIEDPVIYDHLGDVYFKTGEIEKAKDNWQKSLKLDPNQKGAKEKLEKVTNSY